MIVFEGKSEKSKKIVNIVKKEFRNDNILLVDSFGADSVFSIIDIPLLSLLNHNTDQVITEFVNHYDEVFKKFDWIIFYVNAGTDELSKFKDLDRTYTNNFIVTIQNNNKGLTDQYYI